MKPLTIYRLSLVIAPLLAILGVIYTEIAQDGFSQDWRDLLSWSGDGGVFNVVYDESGEIIDSNEILTIVTFVILFVMGGINQIAMFFFWKPSRHIFSILCVFGFVATPCLGLLVSPPIENLLMELSLFISGVTLALCYFSDPIVNRFISTKNVEKMKDEAI